MKKLEKCDKWNISIVGDGLLFKPSRKYVLNTHYGIYWYYRFLGSPK